MSSTPRVPSAVPGEPATFASVFAHRPDLARPFGRLYATLWSDGIVSQALKETARMRNARVTDCGFCKRVRFAGAREAGLDEDMVAQIVDGYEASGLSAEQKLVLRFTDAFLDPPHTADAALAAEMSAMFSPAEVVELGLALAMFLGMAKVLISLGTEPEQMDTTILPTPALAGRR
ncbi:MAG: carboxymuconolactone decarboxylase family protein [Ilumatobacteraceae bacterium]